MRCRGKGDDWILTATFHLEYSFSSYLTTSRYAIRRQPRRRPGLSSRRRDTYPVKLLAHQAYPAADRIPFQPFKTFFSVHAFRSLQLQTWSYASCSPLRPPRPMVGDPVASCSDVAPAFNSSATTPTPPPAPEPRQWSGSRSRLPHLLLQPCDSVHDFLRRGHQTFTRYTSTGS